jgi:hypothetical protein
MSYQLNARLAHVDHEDRPAAERLPNAPRRSQTLPDAAGRLPDALEPGIHGVRTPWIRGFMAFQLARYARTVLLTVPE